MPALGGRCAPGRCNSRRRPDRRAQEACWMMRGGVLLLRGKEEEPAASPTGNGNGMRDVLSVELSQLLLLLLLLPRRTRAIFVCYCYCCCGCCCGGDLLLCPPYYYVDSGGAGRVQGVEGTTLRGPRGGE